jgi:hypothetical protein
MRKLFQTQGAAELRPLLEPFHQAAVVQSKELPEHQECKQLGLGEFVRAVPMRVRRKRRLAHFERCPCQRYRISGCFAHTYVFGSPPSPLQDFSTEQDRYRIYHLGASLWEGTPSAYYWIIGGQIPYLSLKGLLMGGNAERLLWGQIP